MERIFNQAWLCWLLILFFIFSAPFLEFTGIRISWAEFGLMDWQRLFEIAVIIVSLAWSLTFSGHSEGTSKFTFLYWNLFFLLGLASSLFVAAKPDLAILEWVWILILSLLSWSLKSWGIEDISKLNRLIFLTALAHCAIYLCFFWNLNASVYFEPADPGIIRRIVFPGFSNVRFFSDYQTFMLFLLPVAVSQLTRPNYIRVLAVLIVGFYFSLAFVAGSRSLVVTHLLIHIGLLMILGRSYFDSIRQHIFYWCIGWILFIITTWIIPLVVLNFATSAPVASTLIRTDSSLRTELWAIAIQSILEHPLLGIGPMHFATLANPIAAHPHNLILQFATEWGVPATILITIICGRIIWERINILSTSRGKLENHAPQLAMASAGAALFVQSMFAGALNYPVSQALAVIYFAYPYQQEFSTSLNSANKIGRVIYIKAIGFLAIAILTIALTNPLSIKKRNLCYLETHWPSQHFAPRFWQQGWIIGNCGVSNSILEKFIN